MLASYLQEIIHQHELKSGDRSSTNLDSNHLTKQHVFEFNLPKNFINFNLYKITKCITPSNPNQEEKTLHLHPTLHSQMICMHHAIPKTLLNIYFNLKSFMKKTSFEPMHCYNLTIRVIIDFDKFTNTTLQSNGLLMIFSFFVSFLC
jgi:hypothetical protein